MVHGYSVIWATLTPKQKRVMDVFVGGKKAVTYKQVAKVLGLHVGTVYSHLKTIRDNQPGIYNRVFSIRRSQLEIRHQEALARADARSHAYHMNMKKQWNNLVKLAGIGHLIPRGGMTRKEQVDHFNSMR